MDRLGFWGSGNDCFICVEITFQYPLMDRLGFWGKTPGRLERAVIRDFSIR